MAKTFNRDVRLSGWASLYLNEIKVIDWDWAIWYSSAGSSVTQITSRATAVTVNGLSGKITTDDTSLAAAAEAVFTVNNSSVAIGDVVVISARSGQTAGTSIPVVTAVAAGSFDITLSNIHASTADTGAMIINFAVIKAVSA